MTNSQWPSQPADHPAGMPPATPRRTGLVIGIVAAALVGVGGGVGLTLAFTGKDSGTSGSALPLLLAPSSSPASSVEPDPFSAQAGDCIQANARAMTRGGFSSSAVRVSCSDATANYTVVAHLASGRGADCESVPGWDAYSRGVVVDDYSGRARELCLMPRN